MEWCFYADGPKKKQTTSEVITKDAGDMALCQTVDNSKYCRMENLLQLTQ